MSFWENFVIYLNSRRGTVLRRRQMHEELGQPYYPGSLLDSYNTFVRKAGYVEKVGHGMYVVVKPLPPGITSKEVRRKAYGEESTRYCTNGKKNPLLKEIE